MLPVCRCSFYFGLFLIFLLQLLDFLIINELLIGLWFCRLNKTFVFYQYVTCSTINVCNITGFIRTAVWMGHGSLTTRST